MTEPTSEELGKALIDALETLLGAIEATQRCVMDLQKRVETLEELTKKGD